MYSFNQVRTVISLSFVPLTSKSSSTVNDNLIFLDLKNTGIADQGCRTVLEKISNAHTLADGTLLVLPLQQVNVIRAFNVIPGLTAACTTSQQLTYLVISPQTTISLLQMQPA